MNCNFTKATWLNVYFLSVPFTRGTNLKIKIYRTTVLLKWLKGLMDQLTADEEGVKL